MTPPNPPRQHASIPKHCVLVLIALLCWAFPSVAHADRNRVIRVTPNGSDDTAQLQTALEACSGERRRCTIVLAEGVFHTDVLLVHNFQGRIHGQGRGRTIIQPIAGPLRSAPVVFANDPTLAEPYPILLHFTDGGDIELSGFTLDFPENIQVGPYTIVDSDPVENALLSAIMVDGTSSARLRISNLQIIAAEKPSDPSAFGSVLLNAIRFEGQIRISTDPITGDLVDSTIPLASGEFTARDTTVTGSGNVFALRDARNCTRGHRRQSRAGRPA